MAFELALQEEAVFGGEVGGRGCDKRLNIVK